MRNGVCYPRPMLARRTGGSGSGLWPTPNVAGGGNPVELLTKSGNHYVRQSGEKAHLALDQAAQMFAHWPTPVVNMGRNRTASRQPGSQHHDGETIHDAVLTWTTPTVDDANNLTRTSGAMQSLTRDSVQWSTPRAEDCERGQNSQHDGLMEDVRDWATPTTRDHKDTGDLSGSMTRKDGTPRDDTAPRQAQSWAGPTQSPSEAQTAPSDSSPATLRKAGLNPRFALWLMGYPISWLDNIPFGPSRSASKAA